VLPLTDPRNSLLLFAAVWLLLAVFLLPASASAKTVTAEPGAVTLVPDTIPLFTNNLTVNQAHLAWLVAREEVGMQATIRYIGSRHGTTGGLAEAMIETDQAGAAISTAGTDDELDTALSDLRSGMGTFRNETIIQMAAVRGNPDDLRASVQAAVTSSSEVQSLCMKYWQTRSTTELADFDQRVVQLGAALTALPANGNEVIPAQKKLGSIIGMRTQLAAALHAHDDAGIELAHRNIHAASIEYAQIIRDLRNLDPADSRLDDTLDRSALVVNQSGALNSDLKQSGVDTTGEDRLVILGQDQIRRVRDRIDGGNLTGAQSELPAVRETLQTLRDSYRDLLEGQDLREETARDVLSVARSLDTAATRLGAF